MSCVYKLHSIPLLLRKKEGAKRNPARLSTLAACTRVACTLAACTLAAFTLAIPAEAAGGPPPLGTYACASYRTFVGVVQSAIGTLHLVTPSRYQLDVGNMATGTSVPARGTYVVALTHGGKHPQTPKLTFTGPVLGGHWAYVNRNKDGSVHAIVFPDDESEKPFDQGATFCYYQK